MIAPVRARGVDVSHWHVVSDWIALGGAGLSFFGAKATNGVGIDPTFLHHQSGFRGTKIPLGIWFDYAMPGDPVAQARKLVAICGQLPRNETLCLDAEDVNGVPRVSMQFVDAFFRELLGGVCSTGKRPMLYTSARVWQEMGNALWDLSSEVDLWLPRYESGGAEPVIPRGWDHWTIWQDSEQGSVAGIPGVCDTDVWNGTDADVRAYAGAPAMPAVA